MTVTSMPPTPAPLDPVVPDGETPSLVHTTFSLAGLRPARGRGKAA